jgi:hypothetical protein
MVDRQRLYRFVIGAYSPERISMARLARYLDDLAALLGEQPAVHFSHLEPGSTSVAYWIEPEAQPKVYERLNRVRMREGAIDARQAADRIDRRLRSDNGSGFIAAPDGARIFEFPGAQALTHRPYEPFWQEGHLSGVVVLVGSKHGKTPAIARRDPWVSVHLEDGERAYNCVAKRELAKELGARILGDPVRCFGRGRWERGRDGLWGLLDFQIDRYAPLDNSPLGAVIDKIRAVVRTWPRALTAAL